MARKHGTTRWQIYDRRKRLRDGRLVLPERFAALPSFAALVVEELDAPQAASRSKVMEPDAEVTTGG